MPLDPPAPAPGSEAHQGRCLLFGAGEGLYAADLRHVQEVLGILPFTRGFFTAPWFAGIVNVRGGALPVVDLAALLGGDNVSGPHRRVVMLRDAAQRGRSVGLLVTRLAGMLELNDGGFEPLPRGADARVVRVAKGYIKASPPAVVLDVEALLEYLEEAVIPGSPGAPGGI